MDSISHLIISVAIFFCTIISAICAGICIKCLTEFYKERYKNSMPNFTVPSNFKYSKKEKDYNDD